jgi:hypothetical protein
MASTIKRPITTTAGANPRSGLLHPKPTAQQIRRRRKRVIGDDYPG